MASILSGLRNNVVIIYDRFLVYYKLSLEQERTHYIYKVHTLEEC